MAEEKPKPASPADQSPTIPVIKPTEPTRAPDPNVIPPSPVQVQEGFSPILETKLPDPSVKAPESAQVQEFESQDSPKHKHTNLEKPENNK